ncbi:class I SAM-dependent methyltransferase [Desertimonas flava]|uniref:class I SAM-dependent methyltransferase n=1 Tax=Desertimonas flava TaxID=2064846 RepID=UPI0013C488B3|nr:class I SAM-dependent methyltransferase [Desertimonas flava]
MASVARLLRRTRIGRSASSFYRRRIAIPVDSDALVLDVGSGDKPHWRADVLLDRYVDATHAGQRSGRAEARISRPLFDADAADMPFADGVFDYVVCSHVLEHVPDPAAVVAEMTRVGKAGYIEVPEASSAKILDFPSHLWWVRADGGTLVFEAKSRRAFDDEIAGYLKRSGVEDRMARLLDSEFDHRVIALPWSGRVDVRVVGELDPRFVAAALEADAHHHVSQSLVSRAVTALCALPLRHGPKRIDRRRPIEFDQIVAPRYRRANGETLQRQIYHL